MTNDNTYGVMVTQGDQSLRKKIGENVNMRSIFTPEKIAEGEREIAKSKTQFADNVVAELDELKHLTNQDFTKAESISKVTAKAYSLKGKAEAMGYDLMAHILQSLCDYSEQHLDAAPHGKIIVEKHLQAIRISADKDKSFDRAQATELLKHLQLLIDKYHG